jgi:geranylgeranyl pyrophosphate synthase
VTEIASVYGPVAEDIPAVGERLRNLARDRHPLLGDTLTYVFETSGKRIRPALVLLSGKLGEYRREELLTLAASIEVVHTATLVHDDTIDSALTRRGLTTVSALWDSKVAILLGDYLFAQSAELAARLGQVRIMTLLSEAVMQMSSGELRQYSATRDRVIDRADYLERIRGKTASLFAMCCEGAGILAGLDDRRVRALKVYGTNIGLAFQIADDVLDFAGDEATLGKPAGSDLSQGTITLPAILLAEALGEQSSFVRNIRSGTRLDEAAREVIASGVLAEATEIGRRYAYEAADALAPFPNSDARDALLHLASTAADRPR